MTGHWPSWISSPGNVAATLMPSELHFRGPRVRSPVRDIQREGGANPSHHRLPTGSTGHSAQL